MQAYILQWRQVLELGGVLFGHISQSGAAPAYQIVDVKRMWFWSSMIDCLNPYS